MCKKRSSQIAVGIVAFLLCATAVDPVSASDAPAPGDTITITGTENTESVSHPEISDLTVQLEKDAALNVAGGNVAVSLGSGGSVTLAAGSRIAHSKGELPSGSDEVSGIVLSGGKDNVVTVHSHVVMDHGSTVAVDGSAVVVDGLSIAKVKGIGIDHSDSAGVSMTGAGVTVTAALDNEFTNSFYAHGITVEDSHEAVITLQEGSQVNTDVSATGDGDLRYAWGLYSQDNETVNVQVLSGSQINATVNVNDGACDGPAGVQAVGVAVFDATEQAVLSIDDASVTADASSARAGEKVLAAGLQVANIDEECSTATMNIAHGSTIDVNASGSEAYAVGGAIMTKYRGVVNHGGFAVTLGSRITASAISNGTSQATAAAAALGTAGVKDVDININNAQVMSTMQATAVNTGAGEANATIKGEAEYGIVPGGVGAIGYETANIYLTDAKVNVSAEATATSHTGTARAMVGGMGGMMVSGVLVSPDALEGPGLKDAVPEISRVCRTSISLKGSSIDVSGVAKAFGVSGVEREPQSLSAVAGVSLMNLKGEQEGDAPSLALTDSNVRVTATSAIAETKDFMPMGSVAQSVGIYATNSIGDTTFALNNSTVTAEASADMAIAGGIVAMDQKGGLLTIQLSNNSLVKAVTTGKGVEGQPSSIAIAVGGKTSIHVDATSTLDGEWAVFVENDRIEMKREDPVVTLNNSGLVKGRLGGVVLNNASTGTLQATFGCDDGFAYDATAEDQAFYFITETATLEAGTTFRVVPDDLGLAKPGDSNAYALLESAETGNWDQKQLNLKAVGNSPLLGLKWSENSTDKTLIAEIEFMTPAEAGLSGNAGSAFAAALADKDSAFLFNTDPEAWSPNVSGAFLTGMTQTLGASNANIGNRLGGLMGLNTGDEIVAAGGLWYNAAFTDADQSKRDGIAGFDADTAGISLGLDRQAGPVTAGVAFTVGNTDADADDSSSSMGMKDNLFSLYGSYDGGRWFSEAVLSAGVGSVDSTRRLDSQVLTANYDSTSYNALAKVGMKLSRAGWQINPLVAMDYSYKKYDSYTEEGGSGALDVESQDYTVINVGGGASMQRSWVKSWGVLTPEVSAMLRYDLEGDRIITTAKFVGGSTAFVAHGADPAETSWEFSTALTVASLEESAVSVRLGYDYAGRDDFNAHSVSGKVRYEF